MYPELYILKDTEIQELIGKKGVPKSVFASQLKVLSLMGKFCPVCGRNFNGDIEEPTTVRDKTNFVKKESGRALPPEKLQQMYKERVCGACRGKKEVSSGVLCMACHGTGKIGYNTTVKEGGVANDNQTV